MKCLLKTGNPVAVRVTNDRAVQMVKEGWFYCSKKIWKETGRKLLK